MRLIIKRLGTQAAEARTYVLNSPASTWGYWKNVVAEEATFEPDKEHLVVLLLNSKHRVFGHHVVSVGTVCETLAHPREILRPAILAAARAFVMVHQHPSGDPTPSKADRELTRRIAEAATLLQIPLIDHVVIGCDVEHPPGYWSFREQTDDIRVQGPGYAEKLVC